MTHLIKKRKPPSPAWKEGAMSDHQKTIQTLRDFNLWRKGNEDMDQPDPREIGQAIDEAIEAMEKLGRLTDAALRKAVEEVKGGPQ